MFDGPLLGSLSPRLEQCTAFALEHASYRPQLRLHATVQREGDGQLVVCEVFNHGKVATHLTEHGRSLPSDVIRPLSAVFEACEGWEVSGEVAVQLPHLAARTGRASAEWLLRPAGGGGGTRMLGEIVLDGGAGGELRLAVAAE